MLEKYYVAKAIYEKISRGRLDAIHRLMPTKRPLVILDVGCGSGTLGESFKSDSRITVFGIDIAPKAVEAARSRLDGAWVVDIESSNQWPSEVVSRRYDVIILSEVLEHLFSPERLLQVVRSLLIERGVIIITVPNILFWRNRLRILFGHFEYEDTGLMDRGHIHFFSWRSFRNLLQSEKFTIERTAHIVPTRLFRSFGDLIPGLFAKQFAVRIKVV